MKSYKSEVFVLEIHLDNLTPENVNELISDTLECSTIYSQPLTDLVYEKTQGNAFFTTEFLKSLYTESLLTFNRPTPLCPPPPFHPPELRGGRGGWQWDVRQIIAKDITNNVVELMAGKICTFTNVTQRILQLAACIGNSFDLSTLSIISEHSYHQVFKYLLPPLQEGLVIYLNDQSKIHTKINSLSHEAKFKFLHDRVQQAAYSLIKDEQKQKTHFLIGQLLLFSCPDEFSA
ncbi:ATP-binding protein [Iningainema tapete]|uniref:Uncharacterized protein n=1 Tax=Iningainema tapete BLCC-T55 TaxID=2748662 RepID=A0A8J6XJI7_9CYAN|nr:hypothetical protein [Iningainema tapete]MBD2771951.1 hypothetical protein [Iningainema tapete BLCC-T55]